MKTPRKTRLAYSLALAAMATTLSALQAYADDSTSLAPEARPPQVAPAMNDAAPAPPQDTTRVLGVLRNDDSTSVPSTPSSSVPSTPSDDTLQAKLAGSITYITGGIGDEERHTLEAAKKDYNLYVLNSDKDGAYIGDARVLIRDAKDHTLLDTTAGPLFYANLPTGTYIVEASLGGKTQKKTVTLGLKKTANPIFIW